MPAPRPRDRAGGGRLAALDARVGWWPRLALVTLAGCAVRPDHEQRQPPDRRLQQPALRDPVARAQHRGRAGRVCSTSATSRSSASAPTATRSSPRARSARGGAGGAHFAAIDVDPDRARRRRHPRGGDRAHRPPARGRLPGDRDPVRRRRRSSRSPTTSIPARSAGSTGSSALDPLHSFGAQITTPAGLLLSGAGRRCRCWPGSSTCSTRSRTGRAWRARARRSARGSAMTIPVNKLKVMAFSFGAMVGALAGTLFAAQQSSVFPTNFTSNILILIYACLVLGGVGSIAGAIARRDRGHRRPADALEPDRRRLPVLRPRAHRADREIRPWRYLAAVLAGIVAFGFAAHAIVSAISSSAVAGAPGSGGWIGSARAPLGDRALQARRLRQHPLRRADLRADRAGSRQGDLAPGCS